MLGYAMWNVGLLKPVIIENKQTESAVLIYRHIVGPYHNLSEEFQKIEKDLSSFNYPCDKTFGLYYDNPATQEHERLRADIGCYASTPPLQKLEGFEIKELPSYLALSGRFSGAPWLTAFKVYGALNKQAAAQNLKIKKGPVLEIYEPNQKGFTTEVVFEITQ
ncbi:MAG: GyrI-like domain-containing protein [Bdellovibrionales bacterium]